MSAERKRVVVSWSGGKDCAWALHELRRDPLVDVVGLLTTVNAAFDRIAMHGVRAALLRAQAAAAGLPLCEVPIGWPCVNEAYEAAMSEAIVRIRQAWSPTHVAFGDLFLEDVRAYRESRMQSTGLEPLFPLWGRPTRALAGAMLEAGVRTRIVCLDPGKLPRALAGRLLDQALLDELPADVDPCGERGEFHTFVAEGPMLRGRIEVAPGEVVEREGLVYADLVQAA
jgi:uncharacterized protein (TIGR00290 family)